MRMKIDGACHCGGISFEADIDPDNVIVCHCSDCQTISGAPYRACVPVLIEKLKLRGEPKTYVKTADSGNKRSLAFCSDCGTALFSAAPDNPTFVNLRLGWVRQRAQLPPKSQGFCGSAMPWAFDITEIPRIAVRSSSTPGAP